MRKSTNVSDELYGGDVDARLPLPLQDIGRRDWREEPVRCSQVAGHVEDEEALVGPHALDVAQVVGPERHLLVDLEMASVDLPLAPSHPRHATARQDGAVLRP